MFASAAKVISKALRGAGQSLDKFGRNLEVNPYVETVLPSTRVIGFKKSKPMLENVAFIAPSATVMGNVAIGQGSSVWYGAVVRGDMNSIKLGRGVSVGDRAMIHCDAAGPTIVGDNVTIGSGAILHGCIIESDCLIGEGAQLLDGAKVGSKAIVAPGSIVLRGKTIPSGQLWSGIPAKYARDLTVEEVAAFATMATETSKLGSVHALECAKTWQQLELDEYEYEQVEERNDYYYKRLTPEEMSKADMEVQNHMVPGRILDSPISARKI